MKCCLITMALATVTLNAQDFSAGGVTMTTTTLHNLHISAAQAAPGQDATGNISFTFMSNDVPGAGRILVEAELAKPLSSAQKAATQGRMVSLALTCKDLNLTTITNRNKGTTKKMAKASGCTVDHLS